MEQSIRAINLSQFPRVRKKLKEGGRSSFYHERPEGMPNPKKEFYLDYDFEKYNVENLSDVFGKSGWEVKYMIAEAVRTYDTDITSMYDDGGRKASHRNRLGRMTSMYHSYGQQLGWHALLVVAGRLLSQYPITDDSYHDDPWTEWLSTKLLTRNDGLWLSDGMDRPPLDVKINLLEKGEKDLVITGNKTKILSLIGADSSLGKEIVVEGNWSSPDNIEVHIRSALVVPRKAVVLAKELIQEEPFSAWLPTYDDYEEEYLRNDKKDYAPWIVCPSWEGRLDEDDPLGSICAMQRPRFAKSIVTTFSLWTDDAFGRIWKNSVGKPMAYSQAWGYKSKHEDEASSSGVRLLCSDELLRNVLTARDADLLVLVKLRRYEKGIGYRDSRFSHTISVIRIKRTLDFEYYRGVVNKLHQSRF